MLSQEKPHKSVQQSQEPRSKLIISYVQLTHNKGVKNMQWEKDNFFKKLHWEN